MIVMILYIT